MSTDKYTNILMLTIYGNDSALPLHFKVFTDGHVIEVDQGLSFVTDARIGKAKDPYYIDLPAPVVTTPCTEGWATTCLPFNSEVPAGIAVWYASGIGQDRLMMTRVVKNGDGSLLLPANTPVLLHFSSELMAHSAQIEWLARVADGNFTTEGSILRGTTVNTTVRAGSVLTLGHSDNNSNLGFWRFSGTVIPANHAYIADVPASVRGITLPDDISGDSFETSIQLAVDRGPSTVDRGQLISYDLLGRRVNGNSMKIRKLWKQKATKQ
ncbi:MAG: hypothetical protein II949_06995 [Prevotella sp.]|nr:hypothetical protein [Prevotella sp.]